MLIKGGTASGKTTQVPQYIMDLCDQRRVRFNCVVTQPRRIAALSVSRYVNKVRNLTEGRLIGYQVGLDSKYTMGETRLTYMTTGVLLKQIVTRKSLNEFTHIILDEIHERDQDTDFAMLLVKKLRSRAPDVKIILMSATCDSDLFVEYFKSSAFGPVQKPPLINIETRNFPVNVHYIEEFAHIHQPHKLSNLQLHIHNPVIDPYQFEVAVKLIENLDEIEATSKRIRKRGAVLVFLPGLADISDMHDRMYPNMERNNWIVTILHSEQPLANQNRMFEEVDPNYRKIILSTNIAESSITVTDVLYVIDFCLSKEMEFDKYSSFQELKLIWASKSNCVQRQGRAGRVQKGFCYRMVTKQFYQQELKEHAVCELKRAPLEPIILQIKTFDMGSPKEILGIAIEPPLEDRILSSMKSLKQLGAISLHIFNSDKTKTKPSVEDGELTYMGKILARLPLDVRLGKLIIFGWVFGVLEDCIVMAACLNDRGLFADPFNRRLESFEKRLEWAKGTCSDLLALLHVYQAFQEKFPTEFTECSHSEKREIREWCELNFVELKKIKTIKYLTDKLRGILRSEDIYPHSQFEQENLDTETRLKFIKLAICGAFFPLYFTSATPTPEEIQADALNWPPRQTIRFNQLPLGVKIEELACVKHQLDAMFRVSLKYCPKIELHIRDSKLYAVFEEPACSDSLARNSISKAIYLAVKMRFAGKWNRPRIDFSRLDPNTLNCLNSPHLYTASTAAFVHSEVSPGNDNYEEFCVGTRGLLLHGKASKRNTMAIDLEQKSLMCEPIHAINAISFYAQRKDDPSKEALVKVSKIHYQKIG